MDSEEKARKKGSIWLVSFCLQEGRRLVAPHRGGVLAMPMPAHLRHLVQPEKRKKAA